MDMDYLFHKKLGHGEKGHTCEFSLPLAMNELSNPPKQDLITYLCCWWPIYFNGFFHFPATSHKWISWLLRLTIKNLLSAETEREVIGCSSGMTCSAFVLTFNIRISKSDITLIRFSPSGVTARSKTLGILVPLHAFISLPSQSHMQMPFSGSELPHTNRFESGNQAHELTTKPWSPKVCLHVPVSTSHNLRTSTFPHVSNFVSSGLHATKDTGVRWLLSMCLNDSLPSSSTWHQNCKIKWQPPTFKLVCIFIFHPEELVNKVLSTNSKSTQCSTHM